MGSKGGLEYKKGFFDNEAAWLMLDVAITGVKPEMNIQSLKDIRADSPYAHNIMQNWVSFDGDFVQGYLPDQEGFDQSGKQASKTNFMPGSAEEMVGHAIDMLKESYSSIKK